MRAGTGGMKYFVRVGRDQVEISIDGESVSIDGETILARLDDLAASPLRVLTIGSEVHRLLARRGEQKGQYQLSLAGYRFDVEAIDERTRAVRALSGASAKPAGPAHLSAPMPGLIVRVSVAAGDHVRAGQGLVVMEALKMENELRAASAGVIRKVLVTPGSAVEKGTLLLEME